MDTRRPQRPPAHPPRAATSAAHYWELTQDRPCLPAKITVGTGRRGGAADPAFERPLWLQKSCCGGKLLSAGNLDHLSFVESFVAATIRERSDAVRGGHGYQRMSMAAKLPSWLKPPSTATRSSRPFNTSSAASSQRVSQAALSDHRPRCPNRRNPIRAERGQQRLRRYVVARPQPLHLALEQGECGSGCATSGPPSV
jgi:hypothetical protein